MEQAKVDEESLTRGWKAHFLTLFNVLKSFIILHSNETKPFAMCSQKQTVSKCLSRSKHALWGKCTPCTFLQLELCAAGKPASSPALSAPKCRLSSQAVLSQGGQGSQPVSHMLMQK